MEIKVNARLTRYVDGIRMIGIVTTVTGSTCWIKWQCPDETICSITDAERWS